MLSGAVKSEEDNDYIRRSQVQASGAVIDYTSGAVNFVSREKEIVSYLGLPCVLKPSS